MRRSSHLAASGVASWAWALVSRAAWALVSRRRRRRKGPTASSRCAARCDRTGEAASASQKRESVVDLRVLSTAAWTPPLLFLCCVPRRLGFPLTLSRARVSPCARSRASSALAAASSNGSQEAQHTKGRAGGRRLGLAPRRSWLQPRRQAEEGAAHGQGREGRDSARQRGGAQARREAAR